MVMGSYSSIITLNVNGLNTLTERQRLAECIHLYMLSTRDSPQNKGHVQTKSEGLEKDVSHKWRQKKGKSSNTPIR